MKMTLSLITLYIFIFTITHSLLSTASNVIYDSTGNKLLKGVPYYVLPLLRGTGGGLTISRSTKDACPLDITQEPFELNHGVPITITPIVLDENYIHASYPISIEADVADPCRGSNIWQVSTAADVAAGTKPYAVGSTAAQTVTICGNWNTQESCFQVVEDDVMPGLVSYQIQLCPFKCSSNSSTSLTCYNIGVVPNESGQKFLAPTDAIFPVVFTSSLTRAVQSAKR